MTYAQIAEKKSLHVAIVIISYTDTYQQTRFLVARRHAHQHQGGKLEFVGGKIDPTETPVVALIREVKEEIGLVLKPTQLHRFGLISHAYAEKLQSDKSVVLHIYQAKLTEAQYALYKNRTVGAEAQVLYWLSLDELVKAKQQLPAANLPILDWLGLPAMITITKAMAAFSSTADFIDDYAKNQHDCLYLRPQTDDLVAADILAKLLTDGGQCRYLVQLGVFSVWYAKMHAVDRQAPLRISIKLSAKELVYFANNPTALSHKLDAFVPLRPQLYIGVHDMIELKLANQLHAHHPITAAMVSPVLPTATHPNAPPLGWQGLAELAQALDMPVIALGGLSADDLNRAQSCGASGVAGIRGFG